MYSLINFLEKLINKIRQLLKIIYWKIKYGNRIKIGKNLKFRKGFRIEIAKNAKLVIGNNNFFNNDCSITCLKEIVIGDGNLFGENVKMYDHNHVFNMSDFDLRNKFSYGKIAIGNNNWFGSNVVILKNTNMGNRNVIGANTKLNIKVESCKIVSSNVKIQIEEIKLRNNN